MPLSFTVTIYPDYAAPDIAAGMQQFLQQVGIELKINQLEYANFQTEVYENKNFDMYLDWQGFGVDPDIASRWMTSTAEEGDLSRQPVQLLQPGSRQGSPGGRPRADAGGAGRVSAGRRRT